MHPVEGDRIPWFLTKRNIVLISTGIFLLISVASIVICYEYLTSAREQSFKEDRSRAELVSVLLQEHLLRIIKTMESYANRPLLVKAVREKDGDGAKMHLKDMVKTQPDFDSLVITDRNGALWVNYPEHANVLGKNFSYRDWYLGVSNGWQPYVSDAVLRVVAEKDVAIQVAVTVRDENSDVVGIIVNTVRAATSGSLFNKVFLDPGSHLAITDRKGNLVYSSSYPYDRNLKTFPFYFVRGKILAAKGGSATVTPPGGGGLQHVAYAPVPGIGWSVFMVRDSGSVFGAHTGYYAQVAAIAILLLVSITISLIYMRKRVLSAWAIRQVEAAKNLAESENRFRSLVVATSQIIWSTSPQGAVEKPIPSFQKYTGQSDQEVLGPGWSQAVHPDDREHALKIWTRAVTEKTGYETEYRLRRYDGVYRHFLTRGAPVLDEVGEVVEWVGTCTDITERKEAEEALRKSRQLLDMTGEIARIGGWELDISTGTLHWTETLFRIHEVPDDFQPTVEQALSFYTDEARPVITEAVQRAIHEGAGFDLELQIMTARGNLLWVHAIGQAQMERGTVVSIGGTFQDITESKRYERELEEKNAEMERFTYMVSHDLKSPVVTVRTFLGYLERDMAAGNTARIQEDVHYMKSAAAKISDLLDDLLEISRVGRLANPSETLSMKRLVEEALGMLAGGMSGTVIELMPGAEGVLLTGDRARLAEIWQNLVENGIKFAGNQQPPRLEIGAEELDGERCFFVRDNGIGIDPKHHRVIFDLFEKLDNRAPGTGLGLALVKRVVETYGGKIWVESDGKGNGSCFRFTLPRAGSDSKKGEKK